MAYRLYINGNILYLIDELDNNRQYEGAAKSCLHRRKGLDSTDFAFKGLNQWVEKNLIPFTDINDKDGNPISNTYATAQLLSDYLDGALGKSSAQAGAVDTVTGWAQYGDSNYIEANPLITNSGQTSVISLDGLTNTIKSQLPLGVTDLYDAVSSKITPAESGDGYGMSIQFKGKNSSNNGDATIFIDIGGSFTRLFPKSFRFNRGAGTAHDYYFTFNFYSLGTFIANGGLIKIESGQGNTQIYDIILQLHRTHKAI